MSWQPIDTAPKDGTEFILCFPLQGNTMLFANWNRTFNRWYSKGEPLLGVAGSVWTNRPEPPQ